MNKTLTIVGNRDILPPIVRARAHKEIIGVEVRLNERWISGSTVPLRVCQLFNLPQDINAYTERIRGELPDRCLSRAGRVKVFFFVICWTSVFSLLLYV